MMRLSSTELEAIKQRSTDDFMTIKGRLPEQVVDVHRLLQHIEALNKELDHERWQHAACLTIAEGAPDMPPEELQSLAMRAVKRLRLEREEIETIMSNFNTAAPNLTERVRILRQAYNHLWDKVHYVKKSDEDDES